MQCIQYKRSCFWLSTNFEALYFLCPISDQLISPFLSWRLILGSHITKMFFDGRPIERATQKVDFSTHECMRSGYNIEQSYTLCKTSRKEREISWSLIGHKKYNASKFVLNQKQERNGLLNYSVKGILPGAVPARLVNFRSHQASACTDFARFICLSPRLSAPGQIVGANSFFKSAHLMPTVSTNAFHSTNLFLFFTLPYSHQ